MTILIALVQLAINIALCAHLWSLHRRPATDELWAAISFSTDHLPFTEGRSFLKLYRAGAEAEIRNRFPSWPTYRANFIAIEKDHTA